ncbi:MAG: SIR2 family NAD-dependent protein deacylase [Planctomycetota bacterium]|jgi:NAD-dependent deacetylase
MRGAERILVFTGAGISTASGIPDYRGPQGVWKRRRPVYYQQFMASEEARVEYWYFKLESYEEIRDARPNVVHESVVALERAGKLESVVTQNIDGLHAEAGTSPDRLVEIHGTDSRIQCQTCGATSDPEPHYEAFRRTRRPPVCPCGGFLKAATISFGQSLVEEDLARAFSAAASADLGVSLGSTLSVHPAASVPLAAAERGVPYAVVNRGATDHDGLPAVTLRLDGDVVEIFPRAVREALG